MSFKKYQTKPFDCWQKGKELRADYYRDLWKAKQEGKVIGLGLGTFCASLPGALADCEFAELGNYFATVAMDRKLTMECIEEVEARGYLVDICAATRLCWGSMFLNSSPFGEFLKPDFCLQLHSCDTTGKATQVTSEHFGIPYFCLDLPLVLPERRKEFHRENFVSQMQDAIEWMEKVTGKKYDDDKLIEGVNNEWQCMVLWAKVCELNKAIPAPLDQKSLQALSAPLFMVKHKKEAVEFYQMLYDEVQDRVKNQIAAVATERCRLIHEGVPPFYFLRLFRLVEGYGAVFIGGMLELGFSAFERQADGSWKVMKGLEERGIELKTREDALRSLAELLLTGLAMNCSLVSPKPGDIVNLAENWHADGVVFHCDRGCNNMPAGLPEARLALQQRDIPSAVYEASHADPRDFVESQVVDSLETFLESLGLTRLEG